MEEMYPSDSPSSSWGSTSFSSSSSYTETCSSDEDDSLLEMASDGGLDESTRSQMADGPLQASGGPEPTRREALRSLLRIMRQMFPDLPLDAPTLLGGPVVTRMGSDCCLTTNKRRIRNG
ncbi:hypothetical protein SprV_0401458000 [Sparganum proliferum]